MILLPALSILFLICAFRLSHARCVLPCFPEFILCSCCTSNEIHSFLPIEISASHHSRPGPDSHHEAVSASKLDLMILVYFSMLFCPMLCNCLSYVPSSEFMSLKCEVKLIFLCYKFWCTLGNPLFFPPSLPPPPDRPQTVST